MKKILYICALALSSFILPHVSAQECYYDSCCCEQSFDGLYVGGNVGVFSLFDERIDGSGFNGTPGGFPDVATNVTAGVLVGYDWMVCCDFLLGVVADWNWVNLDRKINAGSNNIIHAEIDWFTTIRARGGLTLSSATLYLTMGAAVMKIERDWQNGSANIHYHHPQWGWTGGIGLEKMLICNFSLAAEILFMHFSANTKVFNANIGEGPSSFTFELSESAWVGRIVLNYRFGDLCSYFRSW